MQGGDVSIPMHSGFFHQEREQPGAQGGGRREGVTVFCVTGYFPAVSVCRPHLRLRSN